MRSLLEAFPAIPLHRLSMSDAPTAGTEEFAASGRRRCLDSNHRVNYVFCCFQHVIWAAGRACIAAQKPPPESSSNEPSSPIVVLSLLE